MRLKCRHSRQARRKDSIKLYISRLDEVNDKKAYHSGTFVATVDRCLGEDIGLVEQPVLVSKDLLEPRSTAKTLVSNNHIRDYDYIFVGSYYTGPQTFQFAGPRFRRRCRHGLGPSHPDFYITLDQGIYRTSTTASVNRLGICGAPLLRIENVTDAAVQLVGEILGFFFFCATSEGTMVHHYTVTPKAVIR